MALGKNKAEDTPPQKKPTPKGLTPAAIAGALVLVLLIALGPWPLRTSGDAQGDQEVTEFLSEHAPDGSTDVAAFILETDQNGQRKTRFGGLGTTENTEVEIGSVTKTFTALLLTQMVRTGEVKLDTTVGDIIDVGDAPIADVRLEELVNHTAGVPRLAGVSSRSFVCQFANCNPYADNTTAQDILDQAKDVKIKNRGERNYSNYGYALLGHLLAKKANMSYEELLRKNIFEPAGMTKSYLATPGTTDGRTKGRAINGRSMDPWEMDGYAPSGAIRSTPADMSKYAEFVLEEGTIDYGWGDLGFPDDENDQESDPNDPKSLYGKYPYKNGATGGYTAGFIVDPRNGKAVFVSNRSAVRVNELTFSLFDTLSKGEI